MNKTSGMRADVGRYSGGLRVRSKMKSLCGGLMMTTVVMALLAGHLVLSPLCCVIVIRCLHWWCAVWARVAVAVTAADCIPMGLTAHKKLPFVSILPRTEIIKY